MFLVVMQNFVHVIRYNTTCSFRGAEILKGNRDCIEGPGCSDLLLDRVYYLSYIVPLCFLFFKFRGFENTEV